jgi:2-C-methyl-D-erythritol 4-phosphate cytidylyltransferase
MKDTAQKYAIIMAGGKGLRMGTALPKQFLLLDGKPLLMHTLNAFNQADPEIRLILVLPTNQQDYWKYLCKKHDFQVSHQLTSGGERRFDSVRNGLKLAGEKGLIAIHDGVRPLVRPELINRCYLAAKKYGAAIPVTTVVESIRKVEGGTSRADSRDDYRMVQTPQVFQAELIHRAYKAAIGNDYTDDASVAEAAGIPISLVEGDRDNLKITEAIDLKVAELFLENQRNL